MNYYDIFKQLVSYSETLGFKVINFSDAIPNDVEGQIRYLDKEIHINSSSAESAMYTIIHELGHALSYLRLKDRTIEKIPKDKKELFALQYGWKVIKDNNLPITKKMWREKWI